MTSPLSLRRGVKSGFWMIHGKIMIAKDRFIQLAFLG
jgi:hypothetical protein